MADTGWAKAAWGKIYGQWLCGSAVFVYDYDRFVPEALLGVISKHKVTSFCAPPTIYRFFIREDFSAVGPLRASLLYRGWGAAEPGGV